MLCQYIKYENRKKCIVAFGCLASSIKHTEKQKSPVQSAGTVEYTN